MEYYLCRALESCRLTEEQLYKLHAHEKKERVKRCLNPFEIQEIFGLNSLKEHYRIPVNDSAQSGHNQKLRGIFRNKNLIPVNGDFSVMQIDEIHAFDEKVRSDPTLDIALFFGIEKKSFVSSLENE